MRSFWVPVSVSFRDSSALGLIVTSTVRPSDATTSPVELIRTSIFDPSASSSVAELPVSST